MQINPLTTPAAAADTAPRRERAADEINLGVIFGTLSYRRWLIAGLAGAFGLLAAYVSLTIPNHYTATTQLMLNARELNVIDIDSVLGSIPADAQKIEGEIFVIRSNEMLHEAITTLGLYDDPEFSPDGDGGGFGVQRLLRGLIGGDDDSFAQITPEGLTLKQIDTIRRLRRQITVSQVGLSLVIAISVESTSAEKAQRIANTLAQLYIDSQITVRRDTTRNATEWLRQRAVGLRQRLEEAEIAVEAMRATQVSGDGRMNEVVAQQFAAFNEELSEAQTAVSAAQARLDEINRQVDARGLAAVELLVATPEIESQRRALEALIRARSERATRFGPANPDIRALDRQIAALTEGLEAEIARSIGALELSVESERARVRALAGTVDALEAELITQSKSALRLRQLEREAEADRAIYETFLLRLNELVEQGEILQADARVISSAVTPTEPSGPNRRLMVALGGGFGLLLGVGAAFALRAAKAGFMTDIDLRDRLGLRTLARVPRAPRRGAPLQLLSYSQRNPFSALSQSIRDVVVAIAGGASGAAGAPRTILVTAATSREGCTSLCVLLADFLRRTGERVVIVDCHFRNPALSRGFGVTSGSDFIDAVMGEATLDEALRVEPASGVHFLPLVNAAGYGSEVLCTERFDSMLAALSERYSVVLLDAPPLSSASDACAISRHADLVLFAVRWNATTEQQVESGVEQLFQAGARRLGAVLTLVDRARERTYRRRMHNID